MERILFLDAEDDGPAAFAAALLRARLMVRGKGGEVRSESRGLEVAAGSSVGASWSAEARSAGTNLASHRALAIDVTSVRKATRIYWMGDVIPSSLTKILKKARAAAEPFAALLGEADGSESLGADEIRRGVERLLERL